MREHLDGDFAHGAEFTAAVQDAMGTGTYIVSGCAPSKGSSAFEIDISSGTMAQGNTPTYSVPSQTVTVDSESTLDRRYDLITVDNGGTVSITKGTIESAAPPMPAAEALIAVVKIMNGASDIASGDIKDCRVFLNINHNQLGAVQAEDHHTRYADSEAISAINNDADHSATAPHDHADLSNVLTGQHHTRPISGHAISDDADTFNLTEDQIYALYAGQMATQPSDTVRDSSSSSVTTTDTSYVLVYRVQFTQSIRHFRVKWDMLSEGGNATAYIKLYKNGSPISGTEKTTTSGNFRTKSIDFSAHSSFSVLFEPNDYLDFYGKTSNSSYFAQIQNIEICYDIDFYKNADFFPQ